MFNSCANLELRAACASNLELRTVYASNLELRAVYTLNLELRAVYASNLELRAVYASKCVKIKKILLISLHDSNIFLIFALAFWFRSSVGLEQQPSKLWVLGSNPSGITKEQKF